MKFLIMKFVKRFLFFCICLFFVSCNKVQVKPTTQYVFGTVCNVNLFNDGTLENYEKIFLELNELDNKFNVNKEYSEISKVNKNAGNGKTQVSQEVYDVVNAALYYSSLTENCFNPAMGALIKLWGIGTDGQKVPSAEEIKAVLAHCNAENIILTSENEKYFIEIKDNLTQLDLGAIVKGYAADKLVNILKEKRVKKAVIDLGGNIYMYGRKSQKNKNELWKVGIKNPVKENETITVLSIASGSVVTSGNYERYFEQDGVRYHHIFDSKTGYPAKSGLASVTVVAQSSMMCDALATAFFVAGRDEGLIAKVKGDVYDLVFIDENGGIQDF